MVRPGLAGKWATQEVVSRMPRVSFEKREGAGRVLVKVCSDHPKMFFVINCWEDSVLRE